MNVSLCFSSFVILERYESNRNCACVCVNENKKKNQSFIRICNTSSIDTVENDKKIEVVAVITIIEANASKHLFKVKPTILSSHHLRMFALMDKQLD